MEKIYLDYAATTPVDKVVKEKIVSFLDVDFGNPSSVHSFGNQARQAVDVARKTVADFMKAREREIIFTNSATQANNIAILGAVRKAGGGHVITSPTEHKAVLVPLKEAGVDISYLKVDESGVVNVQEVKDLIRDDTVLVTVGYVNSEVGSIQPIAEIGRVIKEENDKRKKKILFHTDAVQAANYLSCDVAALGVDMLTISGHKIYGPKGAGVLYIKEGTLLEPLFYGATQEKGVNPGTENVMAIAGLGFAIEELSRQDNTKLEFLQEKIISEITSKVKDSFLNGGRSNRVPNNINFSFSGVEGESLMFALDSEGVAVSTGSACASSSLDPSYVLLAMGVAHERAHGSVRISLGRYTTQEEVDFFLEKLFVIIEKLRKISGR